MPHKFHLYLIVFLTGQIVWLGYSSEPCIRVFLLNFFHIFNPLRAKPPCFSICLFFSFHLVPNLSFLDKEKRVEKTRCYRSFLLRCQLNEISQIKPVYSKILSYIKSQFVYTMKLSFKKLTPR